jgi:hypothetical protein
MTERKTVKVEKLLYWANSFFVNSADDQAGERLGVAGILEAALHDAGAYKGFAYLATTAPTWKPEDGLGDQTRRRYY